MGRAEEEETVKGGAEGENEEGESEGGENEEGENEEGEEGVNEEGEGEAKEEGEKEEEFTGIFTAMLPIGFTIVSTVVAGAIVIDAVEGWSGKR